jgi:uncharacterized protein YkwD
MRIRFGSCLLPLALSSALALPAVSAQARKPASSAAASCDAARASVTAPTVDDAAEATICLLNRERTRRGLKPLRSERNLERAATAHSSDMVQKRYFRHESRDGRSPFDRILATRYVPKGRSWSLGENIGWGTLDLGEPASVVKAWMNSPGHRANILNPRFRDIGIGIALGVPVRDRGLDEESGVTYTTDFGQHS